MFLLLYLLWIVLFVIDRSIVIDCIRMDLMLHPGTYIITEQMFVINGADAFNPVPDYRM